MGGVIIVKADAKTGKIRLMFGGYLGNHLLRGDPQLLGLEHDRGAMGIIGTDKMDGVAPQPLVAHPDISLNVFEHVPEVNRAVCIRQGTGNQNFTSCVGHSSCFCIGK